MKQKTPCDFCTEDCLIDISECPLYESFINYSHSEKVKLLKELLGKVKGVLLQDGSIVWVVLQRTIKDNLASLERDKETK